LGATYFGGGVNTAALPGVDESAGFSVDESINKEFILKEEELKNDRTIVETPVVFVEKDNVVLRVTIAEEALGGVMYSDIFDIVSGIDDPENCGNIIIYEIGYAEEGLDEIWSSSLTVFSLACIAIILLLIMYLVACHSSSWGSTSEGPKIGKVDGKTDIQ
jgi:hypothetical protein